MPWKDSADFINDQTFDPDSGFGEPFAYRSTFGADDPVTIMGIRLNRSPDEFNQAGAFEGLEIRESDFLNPPAGMWPNPGPVPLPVPGDVFVVDGADYVVAAPPRNPDPAGGTVTVILNRRQRSPIA